MDTASKADKGDKLWTGLVTRGPSTDVQNRLLEDWSQSEKNLGQGTLIVQLDAAQAPSLTTALKNIIRTAIVQREGFDGYKMFLNNQKSKMRLSFDLGLLRQYMTEKKIERLVLYLADVETLDTALLIELISMICTWRDRIAMVLLIGISTTVELLESRLPKSTIRSLNCRQFDASPGLDPYGQIFKSIHQHQRGPGLFLGPAIGDVLYGLAREQNVSVAGLVQAIKYAYMTHFFSNAHSAALQDHTIGLSSSPELCRAIRSTSSFRTYVERKLDEGDLQLVQDLLYNDDVLIAAAREAVVEGKETLIHHHQAVDLLIALLHLIDGTESPRDIFAIQIRATSEAHFIDSSLYKTITSQLQGLSSNEMITVLEELLQHDLSADLEIKKYLTRLKKMSPKTAKQSLYSAYHPSQSSKTSATVTKNNEISLSHHGPVLSPSETKYTEIIDDFINKLTSHLDLNLVQLPLKNPSSHHSSSSPNQLPFMSECHIFNSRSPLSTVFNPQPRRAIERALSSPEDYLDQDSVPDDVDNTASPTVDQRLAQPPTSILWRLWCEAGSIVNVWDLWSAFSAAMSPGRVDKGEEKKKKDKNEDEHPEDHEETNDEATSRDHKNRSTDKDVDAEEIIKHKNERMTLALFYRGLAELRMMGFVTSTKRKRDCVAKVTWKGL